MTSKTQARLSVPDRCLTAWNCAAMALGILLGNTVDRLPGAGGGRSMT